MTTPLKLNTSCVVEKLGFFMLADFEESETGFGKQKDEVFQIL